MSLDVSLSAMRETQVFDANITHNLGEMASHAGIYTALWRPEEIGITTAKELAPILEKGLIDLKADPERFKKFNPANGWGDYDGLVRFVEKYLAACKENHDAVISVDR